MFVGVGVNVADKLTLGVIEGVGVAVTVGDTEGVTDVVGVGVGVSVGVDVAVTVGEGVGNAPHGPNNVVLISGSLVILFVIAHIVCGNSVLALNVLESGLP